MKETLKNKRGITLIALVITIIILVILAGVAINLSLGNNGIFNKAQVAKEETNKQTAIEKINLKITNLQMNTYTERQQMPTLQETADMFCNDKEIEYVTLESKVASLDKITVGESSSIYTKLKEYPYEFEINSSLQLASINGVKVKDEVDNSYNSNMYDYWATWLKLAGVENIEEYNGKDIVNDSNLMQKVMNNEQALKYMIKSKYFIMPAVFNSDVAKSALETSNKIVKIPTISSDSDKIIYDGFYENITDQWGTFKYYYPFDNNNNTSIVASKVGDNSIGAWIGYDFVEPIEVFKVEGKIKMLSYKIQYSDDKINWTDVIEESSPCSGYGDLFSNLLIGDAGAHRYWRLYINGGQNNSSWSAEVHTLQFYGIK